MYSHGSEKSTWLRGPARVSPKSTFIPISALQGANVVEKSERMPWYSGVSLLTYLENVYIGGDQNLIDFRFPVQRVVRVADFRGYSGQIQSGVVRVGDELVVLASGQRARVSRIVTYEGDLDYAFAPMSVTLCLEQEIDISRGDLLAHPNNVPRSERSLDAMVIWMAEQPLEAGRKYMVKHAASMVQSSASCAEVLYKVDPEYSSSSGSGQSRSERNWPGAIHVVPADLSSTTIVAIAQMEVSF